MNSPDTDRLSSFSPSSAPLQESPFSAFANTLSPIKFVRKVQSSQRYSATNLPPPPPVFTSPRTDLQRETSLLTREAYIHEESTQSNVSFISGSEKDGDNNGSSQVLQSRPSGGVEPTEQYLADIAEVVGPAHCCDIYSELANGVFGSCDADVGTSVEVEVYGQSSDDFPDMMAEQMKAYVECDSYLEPDSGKQDDVAQNSGIQSEEGHFGQNSLAEPLQIVPAYEVCDKNPIAALKGSVEETIQSQRVIRRHLQFGLRNNHSSSGSGRNTMNSTLPSIPENLESSVLSRDKSRGTHNRRPPVNHSNSVPSHVFSRRITSGIGLHLNSVGKAVSTGSDENESKKSVENNKLEKNLELEQKHKSSQETSSCSVPVSVGVKGLAYADNNIQRSQASVAPRYATSQNTDGMKPHNAPQNLKRIEQEIIPYGDLVSSGQNAEKIEESEQCGPANKRSRETDDVEGEGCKRCNCKRSKCLKLYCDCFAAGLYCVAPCSCLNCHNKKEFEQTVLDVRKQIETRNPFAFAPKIVKHVAVSPSIIVEDGARMTPSSARHKRGCNCKKSKCLKKYCECYQAKVGCCDGCRCEGCENAFGAKTEAMYRQGPEWDNSPDNMLDLADIGMDQTDVPESHVPLISCLPSPEYASSEQESDCGRTQNADQFSRLADISNRVPSAMGYPSSMLVVKHDERSRAQVAVESDYRVLVGCVNKVQNELRSDVDTPEILKDTPSKAVKVSSPNKKRITPPHSGLQKLGSSSSPAGKSSRKYILHSLPSFPSLSPYRDSKNQSNQN